MALGKSRTPRTSEEKDLEKMGVWGLKVFRTHFATLETDSESILNEILTLGEQQLWKTLKENSGKLIEKEQVIKILRPTQEEELSLWALDQAVSRFRNKLEKAGIDAELLVTKKGKGYIWTK